MCHRTGKGKALGAVMCLDEFTNQIRRIFCINSNTLALLTPDKRDVNNICFSFSRFFGGRINQYFFSRQCKYLITCINCNYISIFTLYEQPILLIPRMLLDTVAVVSGVWKDTVGVVSKVDFNKQTATISVEMFGRETPVEISFAEVRKLN